MSDVIENNDDDLNQGIELFVYYLEEIKKLDDEKLGTYDKQNSLPFHICCINI